MVYELEHYQELAEEFIKADEKRDAANRGIDDMDHVHWIPDKKLTDIAWFRANPSTEPSDDIATGARVLSKIKDNVTLQPLASSPEMKAEANKQEKTLEWTMDRVNKRRQGTVRNSVVRSSLKYDEVCVQVIDLDFQIKNKEALGAETKRDKAVRRYGRFVVNTYHPNEVHVQHSNMMPEAVVLVQMRKAIDVMREYGKPAKGLKKKADNNENVILYDYWDYEDHVVWTTDKGGGGEDEIIRAEHDLPFLPWVARVGGDIMESEQEHRRRPMLYATQRSGAWRTKNIVDSLMVSEVIAYAGSPRWIEEGDMPIDARSTEIESGEVGMVAQVTPRNTLKPAAPPVLDTNLQAISQFIKGNMSESSLSDVLKGGPMPAGTAFASLNLKTQTAIGALHPAQELAEAALADIYEMFLLWAEHTGEDIVGYGIGKKDLGAEYTIAADTIKPDAIYLSVSLTPDVPLDRQQKANVAMMLVQAGIYSKERAMEDMGITDPDQVTEEMFFERMTEARWQNMIDGMTMQQQMEMQMQAQAAQQQQQMGQEAMQNEMAGAPGGQGFNPAMGGAVPQEAAPGATREGVTGQDFAGNEALVGGFE
jgi:hypothetical protein